MDYAINRTLRGKYVVDFKCDHCGEVMQAGKADVGKNERCTKCGVAFIVPGSPEAIDAHEKAWEKEHGKGPPSTEAISAKRAIASAQVAAREKREQKKREKAEVKATLDRQAQTAIFLSGLGIIFWPILPIGMFLGFFVCMGIAIREGKIHGTAFAAVVMPWIVAAVIAFCIGVTFAIGAIAAMMNQ